MQPYCSERYIHAHDGPAVASPLRADRVRSSSTCERDDSLPRISVIQDEVDTSNDNSSYDTEDDDELSDYESEEEAGVDPSVKRPPASQSDCSDAWSSRYSSPALENQPPQPALPSQRRMSVAGNQSFEFVSMNASQGRDEVSRRFSAPNIEMKCMPMSSDQGPILRTPPKPSNPPLKLYPWMTRKESPPKKTSIKCPYPTNGCVETLPKNMAVWRKHLAEKHGLARDSIPQTCLWPGCGRVMGGRSLNRHVVITHMDFKTNCPYCRERRRPDHLEKHIAKCPDNPARER